MNFANGKTIGLSIFTNFFILKVTVDSTNSNVCCALRTQTRTHPFKVNHFIAAGTVLLDSRFVNLAAYRHIHSNRSM